MNSNRWTREVILTQKRCLKVIMKDIKECSDLKGVKEAEGSEEYQKGLKVVKE